MYLSDPLFDIVNAVGAPISGAKARFYLTGTTNNATTYSDAALTTPNTNPVIADSAGRFPPIYLNPDVTYRLQVLDASNVLIVDRDPIYTAGDGTASDSWTVLTDIPALRLRTTAATEPELIQLSYNWTEGDGGGVFYYDASDTTTADNGGTVIVDASSRRWKRQWFGAVNVKWFGAVGNGSADDTAAIQAAIDYVESINGGTINFPQGNFKVTATLNVTSSKAVQLIGQGGDSNHNDGSDTDTPTRISWYGATNGTVLNFTSPNGPAGTTGQRGSAVVDMRIDCRTIAGIGLLVNSIVNGNFSRIFISNPRIAGVKTLTLGTAALPEDIGTQRCVFDRVFVRTTDAAVSYPAHGFWLTSHNPSGVSTTNTSLNLFTECDALMNGATGSGYGLFLEDADNNTFMNMRVFRVNTTVEGVRIVGNAACDANHFWNLSAGGANSIVIKGTASGFAINPTKNSFWVTDVGNGTQYPTFDNGVQFVWHADDGQFVKLPISQLALADGSVSAITQRAALNLETLRIANGSDSHIIVTDGTSVWNISIQAANGNLRFVRLAGTGSVDLGSLLLAFGGAVSVGAADSGGVGYKLLRIPN